MFFAIPVAINYTTALGIMLAMGAGAIPIPVSAAALRGIDCARLILVHAGLATYAYRRRGQLRQLEGIPGEAWKDWWAFCCCPGLTVSSLHPRAGCLRHECVAAQMRLRHGCIVAHACCFSS